MKDKKKAPLGSSKTEAWADSHHVEEETNISIPSEEAVQDAKEWVEQNEK
ncbi:CDIF630_02480 family spore surface protein [Fusibacter sp. JL298sf-3]